MINFMKSFLKYFFYFITLLVVLIGFFVIYLLYFQSPFYFPKPTGPYAVGTKEYHWIDTERKEIYSEDPSHPYRELMVKVWYPAQGSLPEKPKTTWAPDLIDYFKKNMKFFWLLSCSRSIYSYSKPHVSLASGKVPFPVVIFSHGRPSSYDLHTAKCEDLASHGYIVVAINHTCGSIFTKFPDGRTIDGLKVVQQRDICSNFTQLKERSDQELEVWVADVQFVLDQLEKLDHEKGSIFYHKMDLNEIGIMGHSFGGATAVQVCRRDIRIKAGVDLDGGLFGSNPTARFDKPFMFMFNEPAVKTIDKPLSPILRKEFKINSPEEEKIFKSMLPFVICWSLLPFSCLYYPIEVFPLFLQKIIWFIPMSHIFTAVRTILNGGSAGASIAISFGLNVIYLILAVVFFAFMFNRSKKRGLARLELGW